MNFYKYNEIYIEERALLLCKYFKRVAIAFTVMRKRNIVDKESGTTEIQVDKFEKIFGFFLESE